MAFLHLDANILNSFIHIENKQNNLLMIQFKIIPCACSFSELKSPFLKQLHLLWWKKVISQNHHSNIL